MASIEFPDAAGRPQRFEIPEDQAGVVIGRSPTCRCVIPNHSVGRNHGRISFDSGRLVYTDLGSVNGSYRNDRRITSPEELADGDVVLLGEVPVRVHLGPTTGSAAAPSGGSGAPAPKPAPPPPPEPDLRATGSVRATPATPTEPRPASSAAPAPAAPATAGRPQAETLAATLAEREEEVRHLRGLITDGERRVKDAESRATMATSSLESMHSKYMDMRDQVSHVQSQLDSARSEASDREAEAAELRDKVAALTAQVESVRGRTGQTAEEIGGLKVKLTERDREIERLRRELDGREYDLKALREENERLEQYCQSDTGRQQDLERKVRNLEAVIEENRNLLAEMRRGLEEKDRDLRQVRLGVGIADLEQEKQRLLDDYHKKSRELDGLRTTLATAQAESASLALERDALQGRVRALEESGKVRRSEREDISDHPDYRALSREVETLNGTVRTLTAQLAELGAAATDGDARKAALEAELASALERAKTLAARVEELQSRKEAAASVAPEAAAAIPGDGFAAAAAGVGEAVDALAGGLKVLQAVLKDTGGVLSALDGTEVPAPVRDALGGSSAGELADSVRDVRRVILEDLEALRAAWEAARRALEPRS